MTPPDGRPRLAAKARLRTDKKTGKLLLIYPEAGLVLNATSAEVLKRCTGEVTLSAIVEALCRLYTPAAPEVIEREVTELVNRLADKGLLTVDP